MASEVDIASLDMLEDLDSEVLDSASVPAPAPASAVALPGAAGLEAGKHSADDSDTAKGRSAAWRELREVVFRGRVSSSS